MTDLQRQWLIGLRDDLQFDRKFKPHGLTEASCERRGWTVYKRVGKAYRWRITRAGRVALAKDTTCG